jgi:hypothetical protein
MKKTTKNTAAPKLPAKKAAAPAKKTVVVAKKTTAPTKKKAASHSEPPATFISAKTDIGFGNHLYIRGEGPGLNWEHGLAMDCVGADLWTTTVKNAAAPVVFKLLVNDLSWSTGNDFVAEPGQSLTVNPTF